MAQDVEGGFSPAAPEPARDALRPHDQKTSAAAATHNSEMTRAPATLGEALDFAHSENAAQTLRMAGRIALGRSRDQPSVDGLDLLVAALETGKDKPATSTVGSLADWVKRRNARVLSDFLERAVPARSDDRDSSTVPLTRTFSPVARPDHGEKNRRSKQIQCRPPHRGLDFA